MNIFDRMDGNICPGRARGKLFSDLSPPQSWQRAPQPITAIMPYRAPESQPIVQRDQYGFVELPSVDVPPLSDSDADCDDVMIGYEGPNGNTTLADFFKEDVQHNGRSGGSTMMSNVEMCLAKTQDDKEAPVATSKNNGIIGGCRKLDYAKMMYNVDNFFIKRKVRHIIMLGRKKTPGCPDAIMTNTTPVISRDDGYENFVLFQASAAISTTQFFYSMAPGARQGMAMQLATGTMGIRMHS